MKDELYESEETLAKIDEGLYKGCKRAISHEDMDSGVIIMEEDPYSPDSIRLMDELSETLEFITGDSGRASFDPSDVCVPRALFIVARDKNGEAMGCGAIRPITEDIAELKRMYSKTKSIGVGTKMLAYLESQAQKLGYSTLWLETRLVNQKAVSFYEGRGYQRINNYGKYQNNQKSVCLEKLLNNV